MVSQKFKVILAFETYRVGQIIEPTGLWRDSLRSRGYIAPYVEPKAIEKKQRKEKEPYVRERFTPSDEP